MTLRLQVPAAAPHLGQKKSQLDPSPTFRSMLPFRECSTASNNKRLKPSPRRKQRVSNMSSYDKYQARSPMSPIANWDFFSFFLFFF